MVSVKALIGRPGVHTNVATSAVVDVMSDDRNSAKAVFSLGFFPLLQSGRWLVGLPAQGGLYN